jgi:hypothetical protein
MEDKTIIEGFQLLEKRIGNIGDLYEILTPRMKLLEEEFKQLKGEKW